MPDHRALMERLAAEQGWRRGVELGVGTGKLLRRFLAAGIEMIGVDLGARPDRRRMQEAIAAEYPRTARLLWMPTREAAAYVEDGWADFVFVDAAHGYHAVKDDIARWRGKVKAGGWFGGHDYHPAHPGVMRAVDEAFPGATILPHWVWVAP